MKMNDTLRSIIWIIIIVVASVFIIRGINNSKKDIKPKAKSSATKGVRTQVIEEGNHNAEVFFSGKIKAYNKISIFSEVTGVMMNDNLREGVGFSKGQTLVSIASDELRNSLKAQKSNLLSQVSAIMGDLSIDFPNEKAAWNGFLQSIDVDKKLPALPSISEQKFKIYLSGKSILNTYYSIKSQEERLAKHQITAPFSGTVSQVSVKKGDLIRAGQKIGEFLGNNIYDLETEFSLSDKRLVKVGDFVNLKSEDINKSWQGKIYRINPSVDPNSQMVTAYVKLVASDLKEGMFLSGSIKGKEYGDSYLVPRKLIRDQNLFIVQGDSLVSKRVEILSYNGDKAIIRGLVDGDTLLQDQLKGLYSGMKVTKID